VTVEVAKHLPSRERILGCLRSLEKIGGARADKIAELAGGDLTICESRLKAMVDEGLAISKVNGGHEYYAIARHGKEELMATPRAPASDGRATQVIDLTEASRPAKEYVCDICGRRFKTFMGMRVHQGKAHKGDAMRPTANHDGREVPAAEASGPLLDIRGLLARRDPASLLHTFTAAVEELAQSLGIQVDAVVTDRSRVFDGHRMRLEMTLISQGAEP